MKITTVFGSPRKKGNTAKVLGLFEDIVKNQGHEIDRINITSYNLKGCLGCNKCQTTDSEPACIQKDDMLSLFDRIMATDVIVNASPLYCWGFTAQMKPFIDRQYCLVKHYDTPEHYSFIKGKREALLVTCADPIENNADLIPIVFQRKCDFTESEAIGKYILPSCTTPDALGDRANKLAEKMAKDILGAIR